MSAALHELGPVLAPAWRIEMDAREIAALARRAMEFAAPGPTHDLALALKQFDSIRARLGGMAEGA